MSVARTIQPFIIYALRKFTDEMVFELLVGEKRNTGWSAAKLQ